MQLSPRALAELVSPQLRDNPQFKEIGDQLREDLRGVGKAASGALVERQVEALADRLHGRTAEVRDQLAGVVPDPRGRGRDAEEGRRGRETPTDEDATTRSPTRRRPPGKGGRSRKPAKKAPAKKTAAKRRPPRRRRSPGRRRRPASRREEGDRQEDGSRSRHPGASAQGRR